MLGTILALEGHQLRTAYSGRSGVVQAKSSRPEVIISDLGLPDLSGYEVAKQLRSEAGFKNTLMIAISGRGEPAEREKAIEAGFNQFLLKPYRAEEVLALLKPQER